MCRHIYVWMSISCLCLKMYLLVELNNYKFAMGICCWTKKIIKKKTNNNFLSSLIYLTWCRQHRQYQIQFLCYFVHKVTSIHTYSKCVFILLCWVIICARSRAIANHISASSHLLANNKKEIVLHNHIREPQTQWNNGKEHETQSKWEKDRKNTFKEGSQWRSEQRGGNLVC